VNEEESKRLERGNPSRQSEVQSEEKGSSHFVRNGFEIFTFSPKTIISWGMLCGIVGLGIASISFYKRSGAEIDERISNHRELNRKLDKHDYDIQNMKDDSKELGSRITDIERYINSKGRK
jgi:hypothetical protein